MPRLKRKFSETLTPILRRFLLSSAATCPLIIGCTIQLLLGMVDSTIIKSAVRNKRTWTKKEDKMLVDALMELHSTGKYTYADNGFKPGYFQAVQRLLDISYPNSGLKAEPHIKSRLKTLRANFIVLHNMLAGKNGSGFTWDSERCRVTADDEVWDDYIKTHKNASHIKDKTYPYYEKLSVIFCSDKTTGFRTVDLEDEEIVGETRQSTPNEVEDVHTDPEVPLLDRGMGSTSTSSKSKRSKNVHVSPANKDSCMVFNVSFNIGKSLSTDFRVVTSEETSSVDLMRRVVKELDGLSGITLDERIKAMDVIGNSPTRAEMFFMLDKVGKIRMVQMIGCGSIS